MTVSLALVPSAKSEEKKTIRSTAARRVLALANKGRYSKPELTTFPIDGMKISGPVTMAGNSTIPG
jgi:hypothetical protein